MSSEERAKDMCRRAFELVKARGTGSETGLLEYRNVGMTIQYSFFSKTHRLGVRTKVGQVLVVEWWNTGSMDILFYKPGLWETRLKHLTRGAL
jgi:hypothetical protein